MNAVAQANRPLIQEMNNDRTEKIKQIERNIAAAEDLVNDGIRIPIGNIVKMHNELTRLKAKVDESEKEYRDAGMI
jgi:hypothetical protein